MNGKPMSHVLLVGTAIAAACAGCSENAAQGGGAAGAGTIADPVTGAAASAALSGTGGGNVGTAGAAGAAAVPTAGVSGGGVPPGTAAGSGAPPDMAACTITPTLTMSTAISTVGIVEFTTDLQGLDGARIEFGLDTNYGMTAPVDLGEPRYRTVLLGMKASRQYHYRVVAMAGDTRCEGSDNTLQTGPLPNQPRLPDVEIDTPQPGKLNGGYTVSGFFETGPAFILDADGDYVWWFDSGDTVSARMSYDGKFIWLRNSNVRGGNPMVYRVSMDGLRVETFELDSEFGDSHHDLTVLPDESVVFIAHDAGGCDKIMERSPDGTSHEIINSSDATGSGMCHLNAVHHFPEDDTITFSDRTPGSYVKVTRSGEVIWVLGGAASTFTSGDGLGWAGGQNGGQHGHHVLAPDRMLMFANGGVGQSSMAYELTLDQAAGSVSRVWQYDGDESTPVLGDVQRLSNGNTLVAYTNSGTIHEVDPDSNLVRMMSFSLGGAVGYVQRRSSLYGPPPR